MKFKKYKENADDITDKLHSTLDGNDNTNMHEYTQPCRLVTYDCLPHAKQICLKKSWMEDEVSVHSLWSYLYSVLAPQNDLSY